jgi:hypothetical protein
MQYSSRRNSSSEGFRDLATKEVGTTRHVRSVDFPCGFSLGNPTTALVSAWIPSGLLWIRRNK